MRVLKGGRGGRRSNIGVAGSSIDVAGSSIGARDHQLIFPGFFGSLQEGGNCFPDPEHPGQMRTGLQYMMLQNGPAARTARTPILLFAGLPSDIDVYVTRCVLTL